MILSDYVNSRQGGHRRKQILYIAPVFVGDAHRFAENRWAKAFPLTKSVDLRFHQI